MGYETSNSAREEVCIPSNEVRTFVEDNSKPRNPLERARSLCDIGRDGGISCHDYVESSYRVDIDLFANAVIFVDSKQPRVHVSSPSSLALSRRN